MFVWHLSAGVFRLSCSLLISVVCIPVLPRPRHLKGLFRSPLSCNRPNYSQSTKTCFWPPEVITSPTCYICYIYSYHGEKGIGMWVRWKSSTMLFHLSLALLSKPESKTTASEDLVCLKVKLLQSLTPPSRQIFWGLVYWSGDWNSTHPVSCSSHILLKIWIKVPKTEMTEGKTFIKSPDFGTVYTTLCTASSTTNSITSGVLLKYGTVNICQCIWFCEASKKYHLTSF